MMLGTRKRRGGRAWAWLLAGLLVGGTVGAGSMYLVKRGKDGIPGGPRLGEAKELALVPGDAVGFAHFRARDLWQSPQFADFRKVIEKAGPEAIAALDQNFVPAPSTLDRLTLVLMNDPHAPNPPRVGFDGRPVKPLIEPPGQIEPVGVLAFNAPYDSGKVRLSLLPNAEAKKAGGREYWVDPRRDLAAYFPSDTVLVVGTAVGVTQFVTRQTADGSPSPGPLARPAARAAEGGRHFVAALNLKHFTFNVGAIGNEFGDLGGPTEMVQLAKDVAPLLAAESLDVGVGLGHEETKLDVRAYFKDDAAAAEGEKALRALAAFGRKSLEKPKKQLEEAVKGPPGQPKPFPIEMLPTSAASLVGLGFLNSVDDFLANPPLKREGSELSANFDSPMVGATGGVVSAAAVGVALLLPATQKVREAAARTSGSNNLKQIAIAMHNYHDVNRRLPSPIGQTFNAGPNAKPLLSWRVHILPYIEHEALYRQFDLTKAWDDPVNKGLIAQMPKVYMSPLAPAAPGETYYKVFVGRDTPFPRESPVTFAGISDGLSNTIMAVEGGNPVPWTKPEDIPYDPKAPLPDLKLLGNPRVAVVLCDGSVRTIDLSRVSEKTLRALINRHDGEVLGSDW